ncbi:MAG: hypothetical protein M0Z41_14670 [Peptococcaceae bacterium]|nr:hypothetical protein [Peptococcaceae bacterium]
MTHLAREYGIRITPMNVIDKIVMMSPGNVAAVRGPLGYSFERGAASGSLESELYGQLAAARVRFHTGVDSRELAGQYDRVVVATGSPFWAMARGRWSDVFRAWARGAVMEGRFDPTTLLVWFNKAYANNGFAYLGAFDTHRASLVLIVSDVREAEVEARWRLFLATEKIPWRETGSFLIEHNSGIAYPRQFENLIFTGNAAGLLDYLLGFGVYFAIISGVLAARSIYEGSSYEEKIRFLVRMVYQSYLARLTLNQMDNAGYDRLLGVLNSTPVNRAVYHSRLNVFEFVEHAALAAGGRPPLYDKFFPPD